MKILIFNHSFFNISETFIYKQIIHLPRTVSASLLSYDFTNEDIFPLGNEKFRVKKFKNIVDRVLSSIVKRPGFSVFNQFVVKRYLQRSAFDLIHVHFGFNALVIYPLAKALNIPLVITFHGVDASPLYLRKHTYKESLQGLFEYAKAIIVVSPHMLDTLELSKWKHKTFVIPCGVDHAEFRKEERTAKKSTLRILHSGRLVPKKGVPDLIKVFSSLSKKYQHIQLDIIGDGPDMPASRSVANTNGGERIKFHGSQPHDTVRNMMAEADIFVLNSRTDEDGDMEGVPVSLLEAMSMNLPVISTYHAGIPMVITDGVDGLLANERDNPALETALEKLITQEELRNRLAKAARVTIEKRFDLEEMNRKIYEVYQEVLLSE